MPTVPPAFSALVESITELHQGRKSSQDAKFQRTYTRTFEVLTKDINVGGFVVRACIGIKIGDPYAIGTPGVDPWAEADSGAFARAIDADVSAGDGYTWRVTVQYGPWEEQAENPLDRTPDLEWDGAQYEEIVDQDVNGVAIVNTAGDPYDPPVTRDRTRPFLVITRNELDYDPDLAYSWSDTINSTPFYGRPPHTVKLSYPKGRFVKDDTWGFPNGGYWTVRYEFHFNRGGYLAEGFDKAILNQGYRQLVGGSREPILHKGAPVSAPVPLDAAGAELPPNSPAIFITYQVYVEKDFQALGFPGS